MFVSESIWYAPDSINTGVLAAAVLAIVGQRAIFLATVDGDFETAPSYLLLPLGLLVTQSTVRGRLTEDHPRTDFLRAAGSEYIPR